MDEIVELSNANSVDLSALALVQATGGDTTYYDADVFANFQARSHNAVLISGSGGGRGAGFNCRRYSGSGRHYRAAAHRSPWCCRGGRGETGRISHLQSPHPHLQMWLQTMSCRQIVVLREIPDSIPPRVTGASINLTTGILSLSFSEHIDATPTSLVNLSRLSIADVTGDAQVPLNGGGNGGDLPATVIDATEAMELRIELTERQRVRCIEISGTPGNIFSNGAARLDALEGALVDMAGNPSEAKNRLYHHRTMRMCCIRTWSKLQFCTARVSSLSLRVRPLTSLRQNLIVPSKFILDDNTATPISAKFVRLSDDWDYRPRR